MSKLSKEDKFFDLSDYGRAPAKYFVKAIEKSSLTPIHITLLFGISGIISIYCIYKNYYIVAGFFLILKSILDAADGELSRVKNTPSYFGRYLDSIFDFVLNALIFLTIMYITKTSIALTLLAFVCLQLQGTLYNYYYVILRNRRMGSDSTSKIIENKIPQAFPGESQLAVNLSFIIFSFLYKAFDLSIYYLDKDAIKEPITPNWFMTMVSSYGLGFQLFLIALLLSFELIKLIIPFFIIYTVFLFLFVIIRRFFL
jgi:phosphatidylglycerophosphate synthase